MTRCSIKLTFVALMLASGFGERVAQAQDEEEAEDVSNVQAVAPPAVAKMQMANVEQQVDQWVFNRFGGAAPARTKIESALLLRIDDVDRVCAVSESQKQKLRLAGQGDIKRFFDRVAEIKRKAADGQSNPNQNIWQEIQPMQVELNTGLFGDESLFGKTIKRTLDREQAARYEGLLEKRRQVRHRATVEWFVVHVDKALGLTDQQRTQFIELLVTLVPPPRKFGQSDYWYLMLQTGRVPEDKIKPIFDAPQWRLLSRQFTQAKGMEPWLKQTGVIAGGEGEAKAQGAAAVQPMGVLLRAAPNKPAVKGKGAIATKAVTKTKD
jgi:hypothetical protein